MPVQCPIPEAVLKSGRYLVPARVTNKKLRDDDHPHELLKRTDSPIIVPVYHGGVAQPLNQSPLASKTVIDLDRKPSRTFNEDAVGDERLEDMEVDGGGDFDDTDDEIARMRKKIEGVRGDAHSKAAVAKSMQRPAAAPKPVIKRPACAASIIKRPACATGKPAQPALRSRFAAIGYKGCRFIGAAIVSTAS